MLNTGRGGPKSGLSQLSLPEGNLEAQSTAAVRDCHVREGFVRPAYGGFCFSGLPGFIDTTLTGSSQLQCLPPEVSKAVGAYQHVVFAFFDAFGWQSFERFRENSPFLREFDRSGVVMKATSQFPSTTAAHVTTAHSGLAAFEHHICGWDYFDPKVGRVIKPLPFALHNKPSPDSLLREGFEPSKILPRSVLVPRLLEHGVSVRWHGPEAFFPSTFGRHFLAAEQLRGFESLEDGVEAVRKTFEAKPARSYQMLYYDSYDVACHKVGVGSNAADLVAQRTLKTLERLLVWRNCPRTLLIVSADHGQIKDSPKGGIAVNGVMPELETLLKRDYDGHPIYFSGARRHLCLHPTVEAEEYVITTLRAKLRGAANVMSVEEMQKVGLLGPGESSADYIERLGTVAILPEPGRSVYWHKPPQLMYGDPSAHGGVSPEEMEIPVLLLPLG